MHVTLAVNGVTTVRGTARWIHPFAGKSCEWSSVASEFKIEPRGVYNNRKLIVQRGQDGKNFLDDAICFLTALAGFGTFPRFDTCHLLKPSACRILAFIEPKDDLGGILFCFAATAYIADVAMQNNRWCASHCVKCLDIARQKHYQAKYMHPFFGFKSVIGLGWAGLGGEMEFGGVNEHALTRAKIQCVFWHLKCVL